MPIEFAPPAANLQGFNVPPPQSTDPLQTIAQIGQLRNQNLQQQGLQQELALGGIKTQQAQEDLADQQKLRQTYSKWSQSKNPNLDDLITQAGQAGVGPRTLIPLQQSITEQRLKLAGAKEAEFKNTASAQAQTTQGLNAVASVPADQPDQRAAAWQTERGKLISGGFATPGDIPETYPGDQAFEELRHHNRTQDQEIAIAREQREATSSAATTAGTQATTEETKLKTVAATRVQLLADLRAAPKDPITGTPVPAAWASIISNPAYKGLNLPGQPPSKATMTDLVESTIPEKDLPEYRIKQAEADAIKAYAATSPQQLEAQVDSIMPPSDPMNAPTKALLKAAISRGDFKGVQSIFRDAYDQRGRVQVAKETAQNRQNITIQGLGSVDQPSTMAQMIANYQVPLQTALARTPPAARNALLDQVKSLNPQFQEQNYQAYQKTENDATSGKLAESSRALNTMMGHLGTLNQAADALNNGDIQILNRIANTIGVQTGSTAKTTYDTILHRLGPEVTKAYVAGGGTSGERGTNEEDFGSSLGGNQIKQNIGISAYLADSLIKANQEQYNRGTYGRGGQKLMSDEAEATRQRLLQQVPANLRGRGAAAQQGGGMQYTQQRRNPVTKHVIGLGTDNKWHDVQTGAVIQ